MSLGVKFAKAVITGQFAHLEVFSGRITLFLNTPSLSISSSTMSPGLSQGCTSGPSSKSDPVPTVPDPNTSPDWSRTDCDARAIICGKVQCILSTFPIDSCLLLTLAVILRLYLPGVV